MSSDQTDIAIIKYLNKRGYRNAEEMVKEEKNSEETKGAMYSLPISDVAYELVAEQDSQVVSSSAGGSFLSGSGVSVDSNSPSTEEEQDGRNVPVVQPVATSSGPGSSVLGIYEGQFLRMKKWIINSLDIYKSDLLGLCFPVFVHCYLDLHAKGYSQDAQKFMGAQRILSSDVLIGHDDDLDRLASIKDAVHMRENPLGIAYRTHKYNVKMSLYAFELFVTFVNENRLTQIRKIVNQHLNIIVVEGMTTFLPSSFNRKEEGKIISLPMDGLASYPGTPVAEPGRRFQTPTLPRVYWGSLPFGSATPKQEEDVWRALRTELVSGGVHQAAALVASTKRLFDGGRDGILKDRIPLPEPNLVDSVQRLKEMSKRVSVGRNSLPSAVCYTFHNTYSRFSTMKFSPDYALLAGGSSDSYIDVWALTKETRFPRGLKRSSELVHLDYDCKPSFDDIQETEGDASMSSRRLIGHSAPVSGLAFSPDLNFLLSSSFDSTVRLWSLDMHAPLVCYRGHVGPLWCVAISPQGLYFASGGSDRTARLWSTEYISPLRLFVGHLSDVESIAFHPNCNYVATGSADRTVRLWDIQTGATVRLFTNPGGKGGHDSPVVVVSCSPDGRFLASGDTCGKLVLWDLATGRIVSDVQHSGAKPLTSISWSVDGGVVASGSLDSTVSVWDVQTLARPEESALLKVFYTKNTPVLDVSWTYRNLLLVAGPSI